MALVEVILREKIRNLGAEADVVQVRRGYARNFLIPQEKAYEATKGNLRQIENLRKSRAQREAGEIDEAQKLASRINKLKIELTLATGETGKAFGSITTRDLHEAVEKASGIDLEKHAIELDKPIKGSGKFDVPIKLHSEISAKLKVTVTAEQAAEGADGGEADKDKGSK